MTLIKKYAAAAYFGGCLGLLIDNRVYEWLFWVKMLGVIVPYYLLLWIAQREVWREVFNGRVN